MPTRLRNRETLADVRTIVQLSDLHFGALLDATVEPLLSTVAAISPDVVIVSGDLTQRARNEQFGKARAFLDRLPRPILVTPGNHDIPFYDVFRRFTNPLDGYRRYISTDMSPRYADNEIAIAGINSARSLTFKGGTLARHDVDSAADFFEQQAKEVAKIFFAHHPFDIPVALSGVRVVRGVKYAVERLSRCGVHLFLGGHLHLVHQASARVYVQDYNATMLQAGTATSNRARGEPNSFFVFRVNEQMIELDIQYWNAAINAFEVKESRSLPRNVTAVHG